MFAAVHQDQTSRPQRRPRAQEEDASVLSSPSTGGVLPGAYAEGGRRSQASADEYTVTSPEESMTPHPEPRRDPNEGIPVASEAQVVEDNNNTPVVTAQKHQETGQRNWISHRKSQVILLALIILLIGIVVAVVIPLSGGDNGGGQSQQAEDDGLQEVESSLNTPSPTSSPSVSPAPTSTFERLFGLISAYSGRAVLDDSTTPQSQAFQWIIGDFDSSGGWPDETILERYALASIFYSTNGGRWLTVTDFLLQRSYCDWQGVECASNNGNDVITSLSLPSENMDGTLPREIGLLTSLTALDLSENALSGSIPSEIGF